MFSQYNRYTQEKEVQSRQFEFIAGAAHNKMVKELKQARHSQVADGSHSARQWMGETLIKVGEWLTSSPELKEV
jgi:hypothetical protein